MASVRQSSAKPASWAFASEQSSQGYLTNDLGNISPGDGGRMNCAPSSSGAKGKIERVKAAAAEAEQLALKDAELAGAPETFALTAVNACSLWYEAGEFGSARAPLRESSGSLQSWIRTSTTELHALLEEMASREARSPHAIETRRASPAGWRQ